MFNDGHSFNFEGGNVLNKMAAWWFVSYSYHLKVDEKHTAWKKVETYKSRISRYNSSVEYHKFWLEKVLEMEKLGGNTANLSEKQIKEMARAVLKKY